MTDDLSDPRPSPRAAPPIAPPAADDASSATDQPTDASPAADARTPTEYTEAPGSHRRPGDGAALDVGG